MLIRNFKTRTNEVRCHLFQSFCSNINVYCSTLWCMFTDGSMRPLEMSYDRIFRILMCLEHQTSMSAEFTVRDMDLVALNLRQVVASLENVYSVTRISW